MKNKSENSSEILDCRKPVIIVLVITTVLSLAIVIGVIVASWDETEPRVLIIFSLLPTPLICLTIYSFFYQEKYLFDYDGFIHLTRDPITGKETKDIYRWSDVKFLRFHYTLKPAHGYLKIDYNRKGYDDIHFPYAVSEKFAKLAIKYSGRKNIVKFGYKPFEKG